MTTNGNIVISSGTLAITALGTTSNDDEESKLPKGITATGLPNLLI